MALWLAVEPLVLASKSAARRAMLVAAGIPLEIHPADLDERALEDKAAGPGPAASLLAREKARAVAFTLPGRLVLGADQTLALGARRFDKPDSRAGARAQLLALSGHRHELYSAIAFVRDGNVLFEDRDVATLTMRPLTERFIDAYLDAAGDAVTASVGAYQLEGLGIQLFEQVAGDHFTILGLPLLRALSFLRAQGYLTP